ncbi:UNVERIFIED_CONTAM: hypothetical protein FKN15_007421 [Acipenser sinensis]
MEQTKVISHRGGNATLPCKFHREFSSGTANSPKTRIKWTKLTTDYLKEIDVFVAMGNHKKSYGSYHGRVFLQEASDRDASLVITDVTLDDYGKYKCEIIEGLEDDTGVVTLDLQGRFYYLIHPIKLTYDEAVQACQKDGSQIAKVGQMFAAWKLMGYDRCDGGWLADGSVRYPISRPRRRCSPDEATVRFVGFPDKKHKLYGVYCFRTYN